MGKELSNAMFTAFPLFNFRIIRLGIDYELTLNWAALVLQSWLRCGETVLSCGYPFEILPRQKLDGKMNKSLIRTPLSSSEPGFDVPSQCAWSLSAKTWKCHRNISNCSKVLKEAKIHLKCSSRQTNISRESFFDHFFDHLLWWRENFNDNKIIKVQYLCSFFIVMLIFKFYTYVFNSIHNPIFWAQLYFFCWKA